MKKSFILFDFDGVIADSFGPAFEISKMICPHLTEDVYKKRFEGNINDWEEPINGHTKECRNDVDFFAKYIPRLEKDVKLVPGIKKIITELQKHYELIVISSTITSPIQKFLEKNNLASAFIQIMGNDVHKSKVEKMKMVLEKYRIASKNCVFITDTLGDMREAEKMTIGTIGITWGFHAEDTLLLGKPFRLVKKPNDLPEAVSDYFKTLAHI